jgi:hypothetical protein
METPLIANGVEISRTGVGVKIAKVQAPRQKISTYFYRAVSNEAEVV